MNLMLEIVQTGSDGDTETYESTCHLQYVAESSPIKSKNDAGNINESETIAQAGYGAKIKIVEIPLLKMIMIAVPHITR